MANNRMYLRCKSCGEEFFLGKRFSDGYFLVNYYEERGGIEKQINQFYDKHYYCGDEGPDCFELVYESEPETRTTNREVYNRMTDMEFAEVLLPKENPDTGYVNCKGCPLENKDCSESGKSCQELVAEWLSEETEQ